MESNRLNVGIIGGCMTCQTGLGLSNLFHRVLARKLKDSYNTDIDTQILFYNEFYKAPILLRESLNKTKLDVLVFQIRPEPYGRRCELIIDNNKGRFIINPILFRPRNAPVLEEIQAIKDPVRLNPEKFKGKNLYHLIRLLLYLNKPLGNLFFLEKNAKNYLLGIIDELKILCDENSIRLIVVGIIPGVWKHENIYRVRFNDATRERLADHNLPFIDLVEQMGSDRNSYFMDDKYHLNIQAHRLIADLLVSEFQKIYFKSYNPGKS
jgi:hypothetical protein